MTAAHHVPAAGNGQTVERSSSTTTSQSPPVVDTVIIGTGPAALILSYILNGNHPYIRHDVTHPDPQLQAKLVGIASLFDADFGRLSAHFWASRFSYSTQALPVNTLVDALLRPLGDTAPGVHESCIEWRPSERKVDHVVLGADQDAGGQWQTNPVQCSWDIAALSYADLLTLPGYTMADHMRERSGHDIDTTVLRPTRRDVSEYLTVWPGKVGIESSLILGKHVDGIERMADGSFYIASHHLRCRNIILGTGTFSELIPPRELLRPLAQLKPPDDPSMESLPLLVVGSGFSAADVILSSLPRGRRVLHIFKWDASDVASPLRACHASAYPEYASVFRRMRRAATETLSPAHSPDLRRQTKRRKSSTYGLEFPEWDPYYEGLPNTWIHSVTVRPDGTGAKLLLERAGGGLTEREVCGLQYVIGRRGSLAYLDEPIRSELLDNPALVAAGEPVGGRTMRPRVEESDTFEMAPGVFLVGSLLGDSLIRHAYGGCVTVARQLLGQDIERGPQADMEDVGSTLAVRGSAAAAGVVTKQPLSQNGSTAGAQLDVPFANGHEHLDARRTAIFARQQSAASCECGLDEQRDAAHGSRAPAGCDEVTAY